MGVLASRHTGALTVAFDTGWDNHTRPFQRC